jgi:tRNA pseudouridine55 synthase
LSDKESMEGILLINKPPRLSSFDVVRRVRKILGVQKAGHFGTLDPMATGLMIVALGKATRFIPFYPKLDKAYRGKIRLGYATNTYDADGTPAGSENTDYPSKEKLLKNMAKLEGEIDQTPPLFSAKKYKGKPMYVFARKNQEVEPKPVKIQVYHFRLLLYDAPFLEFEAACSSGTYIRSLAHDLGQSLECGAHLSELERTAVGNFVIQSSLTLEHLEKLFQENKIAEVLIPLESLLPEFPKIVLNAEGVALAKNGNMIYDKHFHTIPQVLFDPKTDQTPSVKTFRLFDPEGKFLALGRRHPDKNGLHPYLVIDSNESGV